MIPIVSCILKSHNPYRVELGRALAKLGQKEAAVKELEQAMTMEEEDINAHLQKVRSSGTLSAKSKNAHCDANLLLAEGSMS